MATSCAHSYAAKPDTVGGVVHLLPHRSQKRSVQWQAELLRAAFVGVTGRPGLLCPASEGVFLTAGHGDFQIDPYSSASSNILRGCSLCLYH